MGEAISRLWKKLALAVVDEVHTTGGVYYCGSSQLAAPVVLRRLVDRLRVREWFALIQG